MRLILISLFALFFSLTLVMSGNSYLLTLIGVQLGQQGVEPSTVGFIMVGYSIGFVAGAFLAPKLLLRVGHIRSFAALAAMAAMASITYPLIDSLWFWALLRALGGFAVAALFVAIESWLSAVASNDNRARLFALYQIITYSAAAGGQLLLEPGMAAGASVAYSLAALLLMAAVIPLSISRLQSPPLEESSSMGLKRLWSITSLGLLTALAAGVLISSFYALVPLYATLTGVAPSEIGGLMSIAVMSAMILAWPIGWLCDRLERSRVLFATALIAGLSALAAALGSEWAYLIRVLFLSIIMAIIASIYSIAVAITNDLVEPQERVAASSTLMLSYGLGSVIGPLAGSWLMQTLAPSALFYGYGLLLALLALYTFYRRGQQAPIPVEEQEHFIVAVPESQVASEFDPRTEDLEDIPIEELFPDVEPEETETETDEPDQKEPKPDESDSDAAEIESSGPQTLDPEQPPTEEPGADPDHAERAATEAKDPPPDQPNREQ